MEQYVLVATDLRHPQFFHERDGIVSAQPFLANAVNFDSKAGAERRRQKILSDGGRNVPPFEVMLASEASKLPELFRPGCSEEIPERMFRVSQTPDRGSSLISSDCVDPCASEGES